MPCFRYAATIGANITIYLVTWLFLGGSEGQVGPEDGGAFRNIMILAVVLGMLNSWWPKTKQ